MRRFIAVALASSLVVGAAREPLARAQAATHSPIPTRPGRLVALEAGHRLHLWCTGEGDPTVILVASTTAPAGPEDIVGRAMLRVGCHIERFLAPVEPGNLLLMGYKDEVPIVSAPGCFRSAKPTVVDLVLPPMLARYRVSGWEVACLGHGGLLA